MLELLILYWQEINNHHRNLIFVFEGNL